MNETLIFKIAAVGILVSVLSQVLKHSGREEQAFHISSEAVQRGHTAFSDGTGRESGF